MRNEITYPLPYFNGAGWSLGRDKWFHLTLCRAYDFLLMWDLTMLTSLNPSRWLITSSNSTTTGPADREDILEDYPEITAKKQTKLCINGLSSHWTSSAKLRSLVLKCLFLKAFTIRYNLGAKVCRLRLQGLYQLHGPRCLLSEKGR